MRGLLLIIVMLGSWFARSQVTAAQDTSATFTLDECIDYALNNSTDMKNARLDEEIAKAKVKETIGIGLPQVDGTVSLQHNEQLARFFATKSTARSFSGLDSAGQANFLPGIGDDEIVASENFFQLKSTGDASLNINQLIFNGSYIIGLQASNAYKDLAVRQSAQTQEQTIVKIQTAFYTVLINEERLALLNSNVERLTTLHQNTLEMYRSGFAEKIDADRIKVNLNNIRTERDNFEKLNELSLQLLKFQMNYPLDKDLKLDGSITDALLTSIDVNALDSWDYSNRADYRVLQKNQELQKLNIKNKYMEGVPVISAFATLGYSTQSPNFGGLFATNTDIEDDEVPGVGPDKWYDYSRFGISLNWSIFSGLQRTYQIQQEKLTLLKIENTIKSTEAAIEIELEQSRINLEKATRSLEVQEENMALAEEIVNVTQKKYEAGVGSNLEVIEAENSLREAQTNYYTALYDAIIAQIELQEALGILHKS